MADLTDKVVIVTGAGGGIGLGLAEAGEDARDAVVVCFGAGVRHGIDRECDVEPVLVGLAGGGLDADAARDAARWGRSVDHERYVVPSRR